MANKDFGVSNLKISDGANITGVITATTFSGSASGLSNIPAGNLTGTIDDDRLPSTITSNITGNLTGIASTAVDSRGLIPSPQDVSGYSVGYQDLDLDDNGIGNSNVNFPKFGYSYSVSKDNSRLAVGVPHWIVSNNEGRIFIHEQKTTGVQKGYYQTSSVYIGEIGGSSGDFIGSQVRLNSNGRYIAFKNLHEATSSTQSADNDLYLYYDSGNDLSYSIVGTSKTDTSSESMCLFNPRDESLLYDGNHDPDNSTGGEINVYEISSSVFNLVGTISFTNTSDITNVNNDNRYGFGKKIGVAKLQTGTSTYTDRIVTSIPRATVSGITTAGAVAIYDKDVSSNSWTQVATLTSPTPVSLDLYGTDVVISEDGKTIVVSDQSVDYAKVYTYKNVLDSNKYCTSVYLLDQTFVYEPILSGVGPGSTNLSMTSNGNRFVISGNDNHHLSASPSDKAMVEVYDRSNISSPYRKTSTWFAPNYGDHVPSKYSWNYEQPGIEISSDGSIILANSASNMYSIGGGEYAAGNLYITLRNPYEELPSYDNQILKTDTFGSDIFIDGNSVSRIGSIPTAGVSAGSTITMDLSDSNNYTLYLDENYVLGNPTSIIPGQSGFISVAQTAGGGKVLSWGSYWDFADGIAPTLSTGANDVNVIGYYVRTTTSIVADTITDIG